MHTLAKVCLLIAKIVISGHNGPTTTKCMGNVIVCEGEWVGATTSTILLCMM